MRVALVVERGDFASSAGRVRRRSSCARRRSSARSLASASTSCRISGSTAPSTMAVRTDCSASSGLRDQRRRRPVADALQRRQHLADHGAAAVERFADSAFVVVERLEPLLRRCDLRFDAAQARGGVDQVLIELAAVGADLLDLALERGFGFGRFAAAASRAAFSSWSRCLSASSFVLSSARAAVIGALLAPAQQPGDRQCKPSPATSAARRSRRRSRPKQIIAVKLRPQVRTASSLSGHLLPRITTKSVTAYIQAR